MRYQVLLGVVIPIAALAALIVTNEYRDRSEYALVREQADLGDPAAQLRIGVMHSRGEGVPQNKEVAATWVRKAALQGLVEAQVKYGRLFRYGDGVIRSPTRTAIWMFAASEQGSYEAASLLGVLHRDGEGVPVDPVAAHMWFSLALFRAQNFEDPPEEGWATQSRAVWALNRINEIA